MVKIKGYDKITTEELESERFWSKSKLKDLKEEVRPYELLLEILDKIEEYNSYDRRKPFEGNVILVRPVYNAMPTVIKRDSLLKEKIYIRNTIKKLNEELWEIHLELNSRYIE